MRRQGGTTARRTLGRAAHPLTGSLHDYDWLLHLIGESRFVLLGEASHGTHEFYQARADISMRLIEEKGFTAVAVEADWPNAYRVNRYVRGEINVGQLVRGRHGEDTFAVGFTTYTGTVTAAQDWGAPPQRRVVRPALRGSYEELFHEADAPSFLVDLRHEDARALEESRLERAIGVVYRPETERISHYFSARLPAQFDVVLHFDETRVVEPLERTAQWEEGEQPETYPFGV